MNYIPVSRIRGNKKSAKRKKKPFRIKTIQKFTLYTDAPGGKGRQAKKQLNYIPVSRIRGNKKSAKQKKKPFRIKTIQKFTLSTKALSSNSRDANKSKHVKGSQKKKNWRSLLENMLRGAQKRKS